MLEHREFQRAIRLRNPDRRTEITDRLWRVAASANAGERGHARIVPTGDTFFLHQREQLSLAEQRVGKTEAIEFHLLRRENAELFDEPVVQWTVIFKFQRADRVRHVFDGIGLAVREIVHRIDTPFAAGAMMI